MIHISKNGQNLGPYTIEEVKSHLRNGGVNDTDFAWEEGTSNWVPLRELLGASKSPPPPPPIPMGVATREEKKGLWMSITSLVLGIFALLAMMGFLEQDVILTDEWQAVLLFSIPALILGIIAVATNKKGKGMAIAGIVTSAIALFLVLTLNEAKDESPTKAENTSAYKLSQ